MGRPKKIKSNISYPSARVLHLVLFQLDKDGKLLMSEDLLKEALEAHDGGFDNYAYILHDKDIYNADAVYEHKELNHRTYIDRLKILSAVKGLPADELQESGYVFDADLSAQAQEYADAQFPEIKKGDAKPPHWHLVLNFSSARKTDEIARWFKMANGETLEPNWVAVRKNRGALENAWNYLIHKNDKTKYPYEKEDVVASFDYINHIEEELKKDERAEKYDVDKNEINELIDKVSEGLLTLPEVKRILPFAVYQPKQKAFEEARKHYVRELMPMPTERQVYYVDAEGIDENTGAGGVGKSTIAKAYAKQLAARCGADKSLSFDDLRDYIFVAGSKDVFLDNYDGQKVLFIDEITAEDLVSACKGISTVKTLLDPFPVRTNMNVKFASLVCTAEYIIINGIQSLKKFKDGLSKYDKAPEQIDRRLWGGIHVIDGSDVEYWINRGLFSNMPDMIKQIETIARVKHNIAKIARGYSGEAQFVLENKVLTPLLNQVEQRAQEKEKAPKISSLEEAMKTDLFGEVGQIVDSGQMVAIYDIDDFVEVEETPFDDNFKSPFKQYTFGKNRVADLVDKMFENGLWNYDDEELYAQFTNVAIEVLKGQKTTKHKQEYFELAQRVYEMFK